uniref:Uncharacterized protein n=1 Tax=Cannabis sativa TaxID=3483 RepID=A0A803Q141_CANSA
MRVKKLEEDIAELTHNLESEKENVKKAYDQAISDYIYTTLTKLSKFDFAVFGPEVVKMDNAFCTMSPIETQGLGGNLFPDDAEDATATEVADGISKVISDSIAPVA